MWSVLLGGSSWTFEEHEHVEGCPRCQKWRERIGGAIATRVSEKEARAAETEFVVDSTDATVTSGSLDYTRKLAEAINVILDGADFDDQQETPEQTSPVCSATREQPVESKPINSLPTALRESIQESDEVDSELAEVTARFDALQDGASQEGRVLPWKCDLPLRSVIGRGGQGIVYDTVWGGSDGFERRFALKAFSPHNYSTFGNYEAEMQRMARVASVLSQTAVDNLVEIQWFGKANGIRFMLMELVDGFDLRELLAPKMLRRLKKRVDRLVWADLNEVLITKGRDHSRMLPAAALAIMQTCLNGLKALHGQKIVHSDIKPSNIMLRLNGGVRIIDFGSAFLRGEATGPRSWTPEYAAPESIDGEAGMSREWTEQSDLASLGYVLIELLSGERLFKGVQSQDDLRRAKERLPEEFGKYLPQEYLKDGLLMEICRRMIEPDRGKRFKSAADAEDQMFGYYQQLARARLLCNINRILSFLLERLK